MSRRGNMKTLVREPFMKENHVRCRAWGVFYGTTGDASCALPAGHPGCHAVYGPFNPDPSVPTVLRSNGTLDWQPIETAPHGTPVLVYWPAECIVAKFEAGWWRSVESGDIVDGTPTHWAKLNAPCSETSQ